MPLEIPSTQAPYKPTHQNVLIGTGGCNEDYSSNLYWKRPRPYAEKQVQCDEDPFLSQASSSSVIAEAPVEDWDDIISRVPASWLRAGKDADLVEPLLAIF